MNNVFIYDPTANDTQSKVRGIGRYMQILRENFSDWIFSSYVPTTHDQRPFDSFDNSQDKKAQGKPTTFLSPFFNFLSPPLFVRRKYAKQIAVIHDLIPLKYPEHFPIGLKGNMAVLLNRIALIHYDTVITDSVQSKKDIIAILHILEKKIKVIYPCLPKIFTHPKPPTPFPSRVNPSREGIKGVCSQNYLLYVGDATWNKNLVNLARAIKMQDLPCVFVGKVFSSPNSKFKTLNPNQTPNLQTQNYKHNILGFNFSNLFRICDLEFRFSKQNRWNRELNEFMSLAQGDKRFMFPGFITDEELIQLYQNALCNLLVSRDEGFGFSYLEASSQKCPSILSDIPVLHEISNNTALFVDPEDSKSIVSAISSLAHDSPLRNKLIKQSYERSLFFSKESFTSQFSTL